MALLEVDDLRTYFSTRDGRRARGRRRQLRGRAGKTLGIVGESGCGKSVTALSIMGLLPKRRRGSSAARSASTAAT